MYINCDHVCFVIAILKLIAKETRSHVSHHGTLILISLYVVIYLSQNGILSARTILQRSLISELRLLNNHVSLRPIYIGSFNFNVPNLIKGTYVDLHTF